MIAVVIVVVAAAVVTERGRRARGRAGRLALHGGLKARGDRRRRLLLRHRELYAREAVKHAPRTCSPMCEETRQPIAM